MTNAKFPRRQFLHLAAGAAALPAVWHIAWAQAYPTRPVRIVVGYAAGGGTDIAARLIAQWLSERLGQQFIIENRPGVNKQIDAALNDPKMRARIADLGGTPLLGSPADFGKLIAADTEKWANVIRAANIKPE
jgi:tripartite-type tricarboxylate transporter receptor subunit TctC